MATYSIKIYNQSQLNKSYVVFMQPPIVTSNGGASPVFTNAWVTFENLTNGGWDTVSYSGSIYAYWSQPAESLSPGAIVDSGGVTPVNTATRDTVHFTNTGATGFSTVTSPGAAQDGSFEIVAGSDFTPANNFVFGLAAPNGGMVPAPVATFAAAPNETYNITPVELNFYVADGAYTPGQTIDVSTVSSTAASVNFLGAPNTTATVIQNANGAFTVEYN